MKNLEDYQKSNWIKRILDYEDLREQEEYWRLECERRDDNIIKQINELNVKINVILKYVVNEEVKYAPKNHRNGVNSKEKGKDDKIDVETPKVENKARKRGRPRKTEKGE